MRGDLSGQAKDEASARDEEERGAGWKCKEAGRRKFRREVEWEGGREGVCERGREGEFESM